MITAIKGIHKNLQKSILNVEKVIIFSANNDNFSRGGKPHLPWLIPSAMMVFFVCVFCFVCLFLLQ